MKTLRENWLLLVIFIALVLFPFVVGAVTESSPFGVPRGDRMIMRGESVRWQAVLIEVFVLAVLTMSYNLMFGFTGVLSFGHAMFFGLGGYVLGMTLEFTGLDSGTGLALGIGAALAVSIVMGLFVGFVSLRVKGVYFAIFTLAIAEMMHIFFGRLQLTRAEDGFPITDLPTWIDPTQSRLTFYYVALAFFVGTFLFIRRLINSPTGAVFKAIRENEDRALAIGFNTLRYKLFVIVIASVLATSAGLFQALLNKKVGPELLNVVYTVDPLLMSIIGGVGTFSGPVIGAAGLHLLDTFLRDATLTFGTLTVQIADVWGLLLGMIFIAAVIVFPQGVIGTYLRWRGRGRVQQTGAPPH